MTASTTKVNLIYTFCFRFAAQAVDPKFCAAGSTDQSKCTSWSTAMKTNGLMNFTCVNGKDAADCYMKIHNKEADIGIFDGGEIFDAGMKLFHYNFSEILYRVPPKIVLNIDTLF